MEKDSSLNKKFQLSEEGLAFVQKEMKRYETKRSAILPCLYRVQKENGGWVSPKAVSHLSQIMDIPEAQINEVLLFYTMYNKHPVGKLHIQVCCNLSCAMNGSRELVDRLCNSFNVKEGEQSADGMVTISRVECLGACDIAPMAQVNEEYIGPLNKETVVDQVKGLLKQK
ncbi:MAG: NAD(P)H-dependent oxidoreductase subunit E [Oligoflexia bacterium]|nr:NAD(P)H-dependent oxidoreductase subunit E [Oligoflexia bacterium]